MDTVISALQVAAAFAAVFGLICLVKPLWRVKKRWQGFVLFLACSSVFGALESIPVSRPSSVPEAEWGERVRVCKAASADRSCPLNTADVEAARAKIAKAAADAKAADATQAPKAGETAEAGNKTASKWEYSESKDEMRGTVTRHASVMSENELEFQFPYSGGSQGQLEIRQRPTDGLSVMLSVTKGQFTCNPLGGHIWMKFDNGPVQQLSCSGASDGTSNLVFVSPAPKVVAALKQSKTVIVEAEFFQEGRRQLTFRVEGLTWK